MCRSGPLRRPDRSRAQLCPETVRRAKRADRSHCARGLGELVIAPATAHSLRASRPARRRPRHHGGARHARAAAARARMNVNMSPPGHRATSRAHRRGAHGSGPMPASSRAAGRARVDERSSADRRARAGAARASFAQPASPRSGRAARRSRAKRGPPEGGQASEDIRSATSWECACSSPPAVRASRSTRCASGQPLLGQDGLRRARRAAQRGAEVVLVSGPSALATPAGVRRIDVGSALEDARRRAPRVRARRRRGESRGRGRFPPRGRLAAQDSQGGSRRGAGIALELVRNPTSSPSCAARRARA